MVYQDMILVSTTVFHHTLRTNFLLPAMHFPPVSIIVAAHLALFAVRRNLAALNVTGQSMTTTAPAHSL